MEVELREKQVQHEPLIIVPLVLSVAWTFSLLSGAAQSVGRHVRAKKDGASRPDSIHDSATGMSFEEHRTLVITTHVILR